MILCFIQVMIITVNLSSTIGNEKKSNPRLQVNNVDEYAEIMSNLNLSKT